MGSSGAGYLPERFGNSETLGVVGHDGRTLGLELNAAFNTRDRRVAGARPPRVIPRLEFVPFLTDIVINQSRAKELHVGLPSEGGQIRVVILLTQKD
jgi:hypothetical protein